MNREIVIVTRTVVDGEPFVLPEDAVIVATEPVHWSMDGKARHRIVLAVEYQGDKVGG